MLKIFALITILIFSEVSALGILEDSNYFEANPGESIYYKFLIWGEENSKIHVDVYEKPEDIYVVLNQSVFQINENCKSYVYINNDYKHACNVVVALKLNENIKYGNYSVKIKITTQNDKNGISVSEERINNIKINVIGKVPSNIVNEDNESVLKIDRDIVITTLIIITIIIAAFIVFK